MKKILFLLSIFFLQTSLSAQLNAKKMKVDRIENMNYYLYSPTQENENFPLVVFLHGGGESGADIALVKKHGLPKLISEGQNFPFYAFAPQNPYPKGLWDDRIIDQMVDQLTDSLNIDEKRIYLVGLSRGGGGIWRMAINKPGKYAAMLSICAASIPMQYLPWTPSLPVWFFHGEKDDTVPVEQTIQAYEKMKTLNSKSKITIYPELKHDCWTRTFENEEIFTWLLQHHL